MNVIMAQAVMAPDGRLTTSMNPALDPRQRAEMAAKCAELFARLAAQAVAEMDGGKPRILVPSMMVGGP